MAGLNGWYSIFNSINHHINQPHVNSLLRQYFDSTTYRRHIQPPHTIYVAPHNFICPKGFEKVTCGFELQCTCFIGNKDWSPGRVVLLFFYLSFYCHNFGLPYIFFGSHYHPIYTVLPYWQIWSCTGRFIFNLEAR